MPSSIFLRLSVCQATALGTAHMSVYLASTSDSCTHKYTWWWRERKSGRHSERSGSDEASPSLSGGLVPLTGEEGRILLWAAIGLRGGEGKLMAAWLDKGEDEGGRAGIEVQREKRKEKEMKEREGWRTAFLTKAYLVYSLNTFICIRNSVSSLFRHRTIWTTARETSLQDKAAVMYVAVLWHQGTDVF